MKNNFSRPRPDDAPTGPTYLKRAAFFGAGLLLLYFALHLMPAQEPVAAEVATDEAGAVAQSLTRPSTSLFGPGSIAAALLLAGGIVLAVVLRKRSSATSSAEHLHTIADMPITQDQRIRLVRVGDEVLLLGITSGQISVLQTYRAEEFVEPTDTTDEPVVSPAFAEMLRQAGDRYRKLSRN